MEMFSEEDAEKLGAFDETAVTEAEAMAAEVPASSGANEGAGGKIQAPQGMKESKK